MLGQNADQSMVNQKTQQQINARAAEQHRLQTNINAVQAQNQNHDNVVQSLHQAIQAGQNNQIQQLNNLQELQNQLNQAKADRVSKAQERIAFLEETVKQTGEFVQKVEDVDQIVKKS